MRGFVVQLRLRGRPGPAVSSEVAKGQGRAWDGVVLGVGEGGRGAVVHDVEASDAEVVVVVTQEFLEVFGLVFDG